MALLDDIPKLLESTDPEEVKMWADKLHLLLKEIIRVLREAESGVAVWSVGPFFPGAVSVGQATPRFIVPENAAGFFLTDLKVTFQSGTLTGDTEIEVSLISGVDVTLLGTSILSSTDDPDTVYTVAVDPPVKLAENDLVKFDCVTAGGHEQVTAVVSGRQAT